MNHSMFPSVWKRGIIVTIPKLNLDHRSVENFRPITRLPSIGNLLERIIEGRLEKAIGHCIPEYQFGFKNGRSTLHALTTLTGNIEVTKLSNKNTVALFLDMAKAFDSVWHKGLLLKLESLNCQYYLLMIIKNFPEARSLTIRVESRTSTTFTSEQGVPQEPPQSPFLYNVYCDVICNHRFTDKNFIDLSQYTIQFADGTALISHKNTLHEPMNPLQNSVNDKSSNWFNNWRLKPNPRKSELIIFNHRINLLSPKINMFNIEIAPVQRKKNILEST